MSLHCVSALAAWKAAKRVRSTEPKASLEGSGGFSRNAQINNKRT